MILYEYKTIIYCDFPKCTNHYIAKLNKDATIKLARKTGWAIGTYTARCPEHKGESTK